MIKDLLYSILNIWISFIFINLLLEVVKYIGSYKLKNVFSSISFFDKSDMLAIQLVDIGIMTNLDVDALARL